VSIIDSSVLQGGESKARFLANAVHLEGGREPPARESGRRGRGRHGRL